MSDVDPDPTPSPPTPSSESPAPRLVFGDDGSAAADVVWLWINNHHWPGWRISVVTAALPGIGAPVGSERSTLHPWDPAHPRRLFTDDAEVEHLYAETDPRLAIDSCSDAALVAVGPRGHGVWKKLHMGSTTDWLVGSHRPLAPVVIVRSARATQKVLLCTDGSDHAAAGLQALFDLPWVDGCRVGVLGVDDVNNRTQDAVVDAVEQLRAHGVSHVTHDVVSAVPHTATFDVRSTILASIAEQSPDLVVVGARGTGGLRGLLVGSVAAAVVNHTACSVLVAKSS
ncbi:hypothetical protein GCM10009641_77310 [Mycobacterium cookii]|uniref:UspA domain-containing protein n=1 Tax=Nocardioides furvisabuli TaxID=375542 RepID=A0ABN2XH30_9ACTN|nr:universal stress protein [Nocardioides furvisabuli]